MVGVYDVAFPIVSLVVFAILTIPVLKFIRKTAHFTPLTLAWFGLVFAIAFAAVANLAVQYYQIPVEQSFVNITLSGTQNPQAANVSSVLMIDGISIYMAMIMVAVSAAVMLYALFYINPAKRPSERYFAIMLLLTAALIGAVCSGDLLTLFIFWEGAAAGSSFLMLYRKTRQSLNATLKYIVMIVIASAFIVFGLSLVYGITGSLNFWAVKEALMALGDKSLLILAFIFIAAGYAIESAIVPFHFWLPDAYNAAPSSTSAFLSALVDQGSYYVLIRVLLFILIPSGVLDWRLMLAVMAAFTMVVGNLFALIQNNIKVLIGNICVADVGYNLVAITSITQNGIGMQGNLFFFLVGGITTAVSFMIVGVMNHYGLRTLKDIEGVARKMPLASVALILAFASFAGIPGFGGFWGKYLVFTAAIEANYTWLAIVGVIMSVLQLAYLFRVINIMVSKKPRDEKKIREPVRLLVPIFILIGAIILLGIIPTVALDPIQHVVNQLGFMP